LAPGVCVAGRFRATRKIAAGAMGEVWAGEHEELKLPVALKVLKTEALENEEIVKRFSREAFLLGQIHSDHVARVVDFVTAGKHGPVLVMELVPGPSLQDLLRSKALSVEEAIDLGIDVTTALRELHAASIVHRDVKPANILLRTLTGGGRRAVFVDLGVSRHLPDRERAEDCLTDITSMDRAVGTIEYMAPEQILCSRNAQPSADLYAVGAILFRAVTGRNVFGDVRGYDLARLKLSEDAPALATGRTDRVASGFEALVTRALAHAPEERYETADELLADLLLLRDSVRKARERSKPPPLTPAKNPWRRRRTAALLGLAAGALFGAIAYGHGLSHPELAGPTLDVERCTVVARHTEEGGRRIGFTISCDAP
jgi:serine/threonine-protein kinase